MKTHLLICSFISVLTLTAIGQTNRFEVGVESGPSVVFFWGDGSPDYYGNPTIGVSSGLVFSYNFPKYLALGTNISFERKGNLFNRNVTEPDGSVRITRHLNKNDYLVVPLLARFTIGKRVKLFVNIGPYLGYLMKHTAKMNIEFTAASGEHYSFENIYSSTENFSRFDIGLTTGLGVGIPIKDLVVISLEARNNTGFYDVKGAPSPNEIVRTNSTNFLLGITYQFGKRAE
jgi:opacity protein-like surface antigen